MNEGQEEREFIWFPDIQLQGEVYPGCALSVEGAAQGHPLAARVAVGMLPRAGGWAKSKWAGHWLREP